MSAPKFRLQSVLDYRRSLVDYARLELAEIEMRCAAEEQRLTQLLASERRVISEIHGRQLGVVQLAEVMRLHEHLDLLAHRIADRWSAIQGLQGEIERARTALVGLTKDMKALEKLQERKAEEAAWETLRVERNETSELAARRHQMALAR